MSERLHIGVEAKYVHRPEYSGGMEKILQRLTDGLAQRGHQITIWTGHNYRNINGLYEIAQHGGVETRYFKETHDLMNSLVDEANMGTIQLVHINDIWGLDTDVELLRMLYKINSIPMVWLNGTQNVFSNFSYPEELPNLLDCVDRFVVDASILKREAINHGI